jgi:hypothetical protein
LLSHEAGVDQGIEVPPFGVAQPEKKHKTTANNISIRERRFITLKITRQFSDLQKECARKEDYSQYYQNVQRR